MLNYGVYLRIPGSFYKEIDVGSGLYIYEQNDGTVYTLYKPGEVNKDFISDMSLSLEVNKAGSFSFSILPSHTYYRYIKRFITYISVEDLDTNEILFYGRVYSISLNFNGEKKITAEGMLSNLLDCPVYNPNLSGVEAGSIYEMEGRPAELFSMAISAYRALIRPDINLGTIFSEADSYESEKIDVSGGQTVADFIMSELVDGSGGYIRVRYEGNTGSNIITFIDWLPDPSTPSYVESVNSQMIEFGINLLDIEGEYGDDSIITGIIPTWTDENNDKHWATQRVPHPYMPETYMLQPYVLYGQGAAGIGVQMIDLPELTDQSEALTAAANYTERYCNYDLSNEDFNTFRVNALDMHYFGQDVQSIKLYDRVRVISDFHGLNGVYTCTAMNISLENLVNNNYTFSVYRPKSSSNDKAICRQLGIKENKKRKVHNE